MTPNDSRHGTVAGYRAGCHDTCCRHANTRYDILRRVEAMNGITRTVDATGTIRRIRALRRLGWTLDAIAAHAGYDSLQAIDRIVSRRKVLRSTRDRIARTYVALSLTSGPSLRASAYAERQGWPPPSAWLDIDNPAERPDPGWQPSRYTSAELAAEWDFLRRCGCSVRGAANQLGVSVGAIEKAVERSRESEVA